MGILERIGGWIGEDTILSNINDGTESLKDRSNGEWVALDISMVILLEKKFHVTLGGDY